MAALGLESAGILAAHTAIRFYTNGERQHERNMEQMRLGHEAQVAREERESQERMERYRLKRSGAGGIW